MTDSAAATVVKQESTETTTTESKANESSNGASSSSSSLDPSLARRLLQQVEFYFSNSNLPKDSFLRSLYEADADHWVDLSVIASFKRMREFMSESMDESQLLKSLASLIPSSSSLRLSSDGSKVTRSSPLPDNYDPTDSTVLASGFPPASVSIDSVKGFFEQLAGEGSVLSVRLRKVGGDGPRGQQGAKKEDKADKADSDKDAVKAEARAEGGAGGESGAGSESAPPAPASGEDAATGSAETESRASYDGSAWVEFSDSEKADKVVAEGKYVYDLVKQERREGQTEAEAKEESKYDITV